MTKDQVEKPGHYTYKMPDWERGPFPVDVVEDPEAGCLVVYFGNNYYPTAMRNIPEMAQFEWVGEFE